MACNWTLPSEIAVDKLVAAGWGVQRSPCALNQHRYGEAFEIQGRPKDAVLSPFRRSLNKEVSNSGRSADADRANSPDSGPCYKLHPNFQVGDATSRIGVLQKGLVTAVHWGCEAARVARDALPSSLTPDNLMAFLQDTDATKRSTLRIRVDLYANSATSVSVPSNSIDVVVFEKLHEAESCATSFSRMSAFAADAVQLRTMQCQETSGALSTLHPAEQVVELGLNALSFIVGVAEEVSGVSLSSNIIAWSSAPQLNGLADDLVLQSPMCTFDLPALGPTLCVRAQCHSAKDCVTYEPALEAVVSVNFDVATLALILGAVLLLTVRRSAQRSIAVQLLLSAIFGVAIVMAGVSYVVLQFVTTTRFGKVGAWALFAAGGAAAVFNGALSAVWHIFVTQLAVNEYARLAFLGTSTLSTLLCYRFLGNHLSGAIGAAMYVAAAALVGLGFWRNVEATAALGLVVVVYKCVVFIVMALASAVPRLVPRRASRSTTAPPRAREHSISPGTFARPAASDAAVGDAHFTGGRFSDTHLTELNDPEDDDQILRKIKQQPQCSGPSSANRAAVNDTFAKSGQLHTQRALRALADHVRKDPARYVDRVMAPDALRRFAGIAVESDSDAAE